MVSEAVFHLGAFSLNPRPLNALTSDGVIVCLSSSDESSPCEEHHLDDTSNTSAVMCAFADLEHKRKLHSSKSGWADESQTDTEEEPSKKKRVMGPKNPRRSAWWIELKRLSCDQHRVSYEFNKTMFAFIPLNPDKSFIICRDNICIRPQSDNPRSVISSSNDYYTR